MVGEGKGVRPFSFGRRGQCVPSSGPHSCYDGKGNED